MQLELDLDTKSQAKPIDESTPSKVCRVCGIRKPIDSFNWAVKDAYRRADCKECYNKVRIIREELKNKHPQPTEDYCCPICLRNRDQLKDADGNYPGNSNRSTPWVLDHCHTNHNFRGYICDACNIALGYLQDSLDNLKRAITYLEK